MPSRVRYVTWSNRSCPFIAPRGPPSLGPFDPRRALPGAWDLADAGPEARDELVPLLGGGAPAAGMLRRRWVGAQRRWVGASRQPAGRPWSRHRP